MWPFTHRHFVIATAAMIFMGLASSRSAAQIEAAKQPGKDDEFWRTEQGLWTRGAVHVVGAGESWRAVGALLMVRQRMEPQEFKFWSMNAGLEVQAALHMIGAGNAYAALAARMLASEQPSPLPLLDTEVGQVKWRFDFDEPLPLPNRYLSMIRDRRILPEVQGNELKGPDLAWYLVFNKALEYSNRDNMDLDKFKKGAEANKLVVFPDLLAQPEMYRGKIIPVRGELIVVRQKPAPRFVGPDLQHIYTGYIVGPTKGAPPYTIVFTELPNEIKQIPEHQWEKLNLEVTFNGYFLSLIRFPAEKGSQSKNDVISPYLVGRSLVVHGKAKPAPPSSEETSYSYPIIISAVAGILAVMILGAILNVWFRRGDRRVQSRLAEVRDKHNPFNLEPADPDPAPSPEKAPPLGPDGGINPADGTHGTTGG